MSEYTRPDGATMVEVASGRFVNQGLLHLIHHNVSGLRKKQVSWFPALGINDIDWDHVEQRRADFRRSMAKRKVR